MADCLFCRIVAGEEPAHVVLDEPGAVGFLDTRPLFKGHVLLVPRAHHAVLADLPPEDLAPLMDAAQRVSRVLVSALGAQGSFVAVNNTVSQSVPHLHVHLVPRTRGDGLRGFFWPRQRYAPGEPEAYAERLRAALDGDT